MVMFSTSGIQKTLKNVTSTNICLLVPHNGQPRCFSYQFTHVEFFGHNFNFRSWPEVLLVFKNIKTRNLDMFFDQFDNAEFIWRYFQLPVMTSGHVRSLPVCREHLKSMTSTLFLSNSSTLNTMKIFSTSGHGRKYFWFWSSILLSESWTARLPRPMVQLDRQWQSVCYWGLGGEVTM